MVHAEFPDRSRHRADAPKDRDPIPDDAVDDAVDDAITDGSDDETAAASDAPADRPIRAIDRFRTGALGSVTAAAMLGLRDALEGRRDERPTVERPAPAPLEDDEDFELHLEPGAPEQSYVVFRRPLPPPDGEAPKT